MSSIQLLKERLTSDLSNARIGYQNKLTAATLTAAEPALIPNTWERWEDASGAMTGEFQPASATTFDYIAIGAHNLFAAGVLSVKFQYSLTIGSGWVDIEAVTIKDNKPIMVTFDPIDDVAEIRIQIDSDGSTDREIGAVYAGEVLVMQRAIYGGHSPINLSNETSYQNAISETGQFLGRRETRRGIATSYSWDNLEPDWYRENFQPFVESARSTPFFIQWRPDRYPGEVAFGFTTAPIKPSNAGGGIDLMSVGFNMRGHDE